MRDFPAAIITEGIWRYYMVSITSQLPNSKTDPNIKHTEPKQTYIQENTKQIRSRFRKKI